MATKIEYRVYREAQVTDENEILDPVLIDSFQNQGEAYNLVNKLVKKDNDEFAHEYYYTSLYEYKVFSLEGAKDWIFNEPFGKRFSNPKTASGLFKQLDI